MKTCRQLANRKRLKRVRRRGHGPEYWESIHGYEWRRVLAHKEFLEGVNAHLRRVARAIGRIGIPFEQAARNMGKFGQALSKLERGEADAL